MTWTHAGAFALMFFVDWAWAGYMNAVTARRPLSAGLHSVVLFLLGGLNVLAFVHDPVLLVPGAAGAFLGTAWATANGAGAGPDDRGDPERAGKCPRCGGWDDPGVPDDFQCDGTCEEDDR